MTTPADMPLRRFAIFLQFACCMLPFAFSPSPLSAAVPYQPMHPDPVVEAWRWRAFPELRGLGLRCMAEGKDGSMWFGADDGVRRYDGRKWTAYTLDDSLLAAPVNCLCATRDGSVYAGTGFGIARFREGAWRRVFPPDGELRWPTYDLVETSDGDCWAGTMWGALHLDRATLYTTQEAGDVLKGRTPGLQISILPNEAIPIRWDGLVS